MSKATLKPVVISTKPIDLDKLDADQIGNGFRFDAVDHGKRAVAMITAVEGLKVERSQKAILAGIYLHQVKAALGHGEFESWASTHLGKTVRTARNYMGLAAKFSRSSRLLLPEIVGANQLSLDLTAKGDDSKAFMGKLTKFVGAHGLTDLMHRHGVIKQGGKQTKKKPTANDEPEPEPTAEEAEAAARTSALDAVATAEKALLDDVLWHDLTPAAAVMIEAKLKALSTEFHDRLLKLKHAHAA